MLANPRVLAGALAVALEDDVGVDAREQALAEIDRHPIAQQAVDGLLVERRGDEPRVDAGRHGRPHPDAAIAGAAGPPTRSERCHEDGRRIFIWSCRAGLSPSNQRTPTSVPMGLPAMQD